MPTTCWIAPETPLQNTFRRYCLSGLANLQFMRKPACLVRLSYRLPRADPSANSWISWSLAHAHPFPPHTWQASARLAVSVTSFWVQVLSCAYPLLWVQLSLQWPFLVSSHRTQGFHDFGWQWPFADDLLQRIVAIIFPPNAGRLAKQSVSDQYQALSYLQSNRSQGQWPQHWPSLSVRRCPYNKFPVYMFLLTDSWFHVTFSR